MIHIRKPNRMNDVDYSLDGFYFVTFVTKDRMHWFGEIENVKMKLNIYGEILLNCWHELPRHYPTCILDEIIIMPNHVHAIIEIDNSKNVTLVSDGNTNKGRDRFKTCPYPDPNHLKITNEIIFRKQNHGLSEFIRALKTFSSCRINEISKNQFLWQRSFYDRIIRTQKEYINIKNYIRNNPLHWEEEENNV